ncbi:nucleoside hydrolase [Eubacterium aggregans]|uniref:nucleoside hydrolase n=1 Tax=Eubacterium aggregans TaxID=81409 RepID=UPI003F2EC30A
MDTDLTWMKDDTLMVFAMLQADAANQVDLLGITTVGGNDLVARETATCLSLLEKAERTDIKGYQGVDVPLAGFRSSAEDLATMSTMNYIGAYAYLEDYTTDYKNLGNLTMAVDAPKTEVQETSALTLWWMRLRTIRMPYKSVSRRIGKSRPLFPTIVKHAV